MRLVICGAYTFRSHQQISAEQSRILLLSLLMKGRSLFPLICFFNVKLNRKSKKMLEKSVRYAVQPQQPTISAHFTRKKENEGMLNSE